MIKMQSGDIEYEVDEHLATISFDRPEKLNALTLAMIQDTVRAFQDADSNENVRVIIITGAGEAFCTGADLEETIPKATGDSDDKLRLESHEYDLTFRHNPITTPVIAAVNGYCIAGGMELLQATDIRIAAADAEFGLQEPRWGIAPTGGSLVRLPQQLPYCRAMEYLLTGDIFPAEHALEAGLINEIVSAGTTVNRAREVAASIAENSPYALRKMKETIRRSYSRPLSEAFAIEDDAASEILAHEDAHEGPKSFLNDEEPSFRL